MVVLWLNDVAFSWLQDGFGAKSKGFSRILTVYKPERPSALRLRGLLLEVDTDQSGFLGFSEFKMLMGDFRTLARASCEPGFTRF